MSLKVLETIVRDGTVYERFLTDMDGGCHYKVTRMTRDGNDIPVGSIDVVLAADVRWDAAEILVPIPAVARIFEAELEAGRAAAKPGISESEFCEQEGRYAALRDALAEMGYNQRIDFAKGGAK